VGGAHPSLNGHRVWGGGLSAPILCSTALVPAAFLCADELRQLDPALGETPCRKGVSRRQAAGRLTKHVGVRVHARRIDTLCGTMGMARDCPLLRAQEDTMPQPILDQVGGPVERVVGLIG
jgi:hypothetical protein